ncbi:phosphate system positive regulatory protein pho81, partial [Nowakowskiella sp. JEL0078]
GEFKVRLRSLVDKKRIVLLRTNPTHASLLHLKEAFSQFQQDLAKLQKFVDTNAEGFRKILKKWDKRVKASTKELYLSRQVEIQPCFNNEELTKLNDISASNLAELDQLLEGLEPEKSIPKTSTFDALSPNSTSEEAVDDAETQFAMLFINGETSLIKEYFENRSNTQSEDNDFISRVFLRVCTESSMECLDILIKTGEINYDYKDDITNRTCLHASATHKRFDILQICVQNGGNVDIGDLYERKPLHYAAMYGSSECAEYLIAFHANVDSIDHDGWSPLVYSIVNGHTECVRMLIENGAAIEPPSFISPIPLSLACQYGYLEMVTMLLSKGARLIANADGLSPLHLTAREGHYDVTQLLIENGADFEAKDGFKGWTPIFYAASEGKLECVKILLAAGAQINLKDENNWLPWTYALHRGHIEVARLIAVPDGLTSFTVAEEHLVETETNLRTRTKSLDASIKPMAPSGLFSAEVNFKPKELEIDTEIDLDLIPTLSLPPPIIPFRIYGHNYLEGKCYIQVMLTSVKTNSTLGGPSFNSPIHLFASRQLSSLKLVISSKPETNVPYSVILPQKDDFEAFTFLVDDKDILDENSAQVFALQFDIYPTFGTKLIGRSVVLASQLRTAALASVTGAVEAERCVCPLFDQHLRVVGEFAFAFSMVKPFVHPRLKIGGGVETYWKSTKVVEMAKQSVVSKGGVGNSSSWLDNSTELGSRMYFQSFVTASSLDEEYIHIVVQVTRDGTPVVYPDWFLNLINNEDNENTVKINVSSLTYSQGLAIASTIGKVTSIVGVADEPTQPVTISSQFGKRPSFIQARRLPNTEIAKLISKSYCSLEEVLQSLPTNISICIEIKYPTAAESTYHNLLMNSDINKYVDAILRVVYDAASSSNHVSQRNIIFSSFNPSVCTAIGWKQPNYGVFFASRCGYKPDIRRKRRKTISEPPNSLNSKFKSEEDSVMSPRGIFSFATATHAMASPRVYVPVQEPGVVDGEPEIIETDRRCLSIKEAVKFAKSSNFLGVFCDARPLIQVPMLINTIKHSGLILGSFGAANENPANVLLQEENGVDAIIANYSITTVQKL